MEFLVEFQISRLIPRPHHINANDGCFANKRRINSKQESYNNEFRSHSCLYVLGLFKDPQHSCVHLSEQNTLELF